MEGILASLVPTLATAALAWHTTRVRRDRDQLDQQRCERIKTLEETVKDHAAKGRNLELAMERMQAASQAVTDDTRELKEELTDIRANMVRKEDFAEAMKALRDHISDALRLTPHNKRR